MHRLGRVAAVKDTNARFLQGKVQSFVTCYGVCYYPAFIGVLLMLFVGSIYNHIIRFLNRIILLVVAEGWPSRKEKGKN